MPKRRSRFILAVAGIAIAGAVAASWLAFRHARAPSAVPVAASATPRAQTIAFEIRLDHAVDDATITVDGRPAVGKPARIEVPRQRRPVTIVVDAPGYKQQRLDATPDRDQLLLLSLDPLPSPTAAPAPGPSASAVAPSQPKRRSGSPRLITDYPF
jgi:hypothetical protein